MPIDESNLARLVILVQRLLDSDLLTEAQCTALLEEPTAALHALQKGRGDQADMHVRRAEGLMDDFIQTGALTEAEARPVVDGIHAIQAPHQVTGDR